MKSDLFDHTYLVNLQQHRGRRLRTLDHLNSFGISPTVFDATDGYLPPVLTKYETYAQKELGELSYFKKFNKLEVWMNKLFIDSPGAFGYIDTYIRVLKDAKQKGYKSILILEDDVLLSKDFNERIVSFFSKLPESWKFINLGASQYNWDPVNLDEAHLHGYYTPTQLDTCGSFAIAINDSIYDELIELQSYFEAPFDHLPLGEIYKRYSSDCFVAFPFMVMPDVRSSSIRGSRNQLIHAHKMKWDPSLFEYPPKRPIINLVLTSKEQAKYFNSFGDNNTYPFDLNIYIPSLDGLRPYHDSSQVIESSLDASAIIFPNTGFCVKAKRRKPITEDALISLYESLDFDSTDDFELLDNNAKRIDLDRVTVIIPTYKRADLLEDVLLSVIEQDYKNKEIIVVDDNLKGSDEQIKTERVVSSLIEAYSDVCLVYISHYRNRRGAGARNTGIINSTGNYICFLDDDDLYLQGRLSLSIEKLKYTPRYIGAVYCGFTGGNSAARTNERYTEGNLSQELLLLNYLAHFLNTNTATYKREAIIALNGFDETFIRHQDLEFNLRFFEQYEMRVVSEQLVSIRPRPTTTDNQQYGMDLFETKQKFLKKFSYIINRYDKGTQKLIYDKHWSEVVKYASNDEKFEQVLLNELYNGHIQCYQILKEHQRLLIGEKAPKNNFSPSPVNGLPNNKAIKDLREKKTCSNVVVSNYRPLNYWQQKGVKVFSLFFGMFILPPQKRKLRSNPKAFFADSKNTFTRSVGKFLKII